MKGRVKKIKRGGKKKSQAIEWMTTEFPYFHKRPGFEAKLVLVALIFVAIFVFYRQYLLALILILTAIVLYQLANQKPRRTKVTVSQEGVTLRGKTYFFEKLFGFWLTYPAEGPLLHIETKGFPHHTEVIALGEQNPQIVRKILKRHLPERPYGETLSDRLLEKLGI